MTKAEHEIIEGWLKERTEVTLKSLKESNDVPMIGHFYQKLQALYTVTSDFNIQATFNGLQETKENNE